MAGIAIKEKKKLVNEFEKRAYKRLWNRIELHNCDLLVFTSEGQNITQFNSFYNCLPNIPFLSFVHIIWHVLKRKNDRDFKALMSKAECLFVFENYLIDPLRDFNDNIYRFPYQIYDNEASLPEKTKFGHIKIGTIGVINDRRNIHFIINSLSEYTGPYFEYYLWGKPLDKYGFTVKKLAENFTDKANVKIITKFEYLTDEEYHRLITDCDFIVLAYDEVRKYQAPGIVYQAVKNGTPLIVPEIEPFTLLDKECPGIFVFYDNVYIIIYFW